MRTLFDLIEGALGRVTSYAPHVHINVQFGHNTENILIPEIFDRHFGLHQQDDADVEPVTLRTRDPKTAS